MIKFLEKHLPFKGSDDELIRFSLFGRFFASLVIFVAWPTMAIVTGIREGFGAAIGVVLAPIMGTLLILGFCKLIMWACE
jgi:hypothetical protein